MVSPASLDDAAESCGVGRGSGKGAADMRVTWFRETMRDWDRAAVRRSECDGSVSLTWLTPGDRPDWSVCHVSPRLCSARASAR